MRTIDEIYNQMVVEKNANAELSTKLTSTSATAVWKALFYIYAVAIWIHEGLMYQFQAEIDARIKNAYAGTKPWYHRKALDFQIGDTVQILENGYVGYATIDETKKIVKYAAVVENGNTLQIKIAGVNLTELSTPEAAAFEAYLNKIKFAGTKTGVVNMPADELIIDIDIYYDSQLIDSTGESITTPGTHPVNEAIANYLATITFGGTLVKSKLIDAVQVAHGVCDVHLSQIQAKAFQQSYAIVSGNIYTALSGKFSVDTYNITYIPCNIT